MFWNIGGYNEDYIKYYYNGASGMFRQQLKRRYKDRVELENVWTLYFSPFVIEDASPIEKRNRRRGLTVDEKPTNHLRFEWVKIMLQHNYKQMREEKEKKKEHIIKSILSDISYGEYTEKGLNSMSEEQLENISNSLSLVG